MSEFVELSEAIERYVKDSDIVALEGFTHLIPFAAGHEIIRQGRGDLTLVRMTPDLIYDQMIDHCFPPIEPRSGGRIRAWLRAPRARRCRTRKG